MNLREAWALFLVWLTACSGTPQVVHRNTGMPPDEAQPGAAHYELLELTPATSHREPVPVPKEDFQRAMRKVATDIVPSSQPMEHARLLMEGGLHANLLAEVGRGRVVRLTPLEDDSPLDASTAADYQRKYLDMCQRELGGGDCMGLMADGPTLTREDLRTLALGLALRQVLRETRVALKDMVSPQAVVAMVVCAASAYLLLWLLPDPATKLLAAGVTLTMLAWLPVDTAWNLLDGWGQLVHAVDRATSYEQIEEASARFSQLMGENTARVLVMLITAALGGGGARFAAKLPKLPGFSRAMVRAEAQGMNLAAAGEVEMVAASEGRTFTLMVRRPGGGAATAAAESAEMRMGITTIIRHIGGNRQIFFNGQRWHLPANKSIRDIPTSDPVGDQLQAAALEAARSWSRASFTQGELNAINHARAQGQHFRAHLMERMFRGKHIEQVLRERFKHLQWNSKGVDAVDPVTGYRYEILSGTKSNLELHGRRMTEDFFRMIAF